MQWIEVKDFLEQLSGLDRDSLHIYAGVGIQLISALTFRRRLASPFPWLLVLVAALANEYNDLSYLPEAERHSAGGYGESISDIWNTISLPTILLVIANIWPNWLVPRPKVDGINSAPPTNSIDDLSSKQ